MSTTPAPFVPPDTVEALAGLSMPLAEAMRSQRRSAGCTSPPSTKKCCARCWRSH